MTTEFKASREEAAERSSGGGGERASSSSSSSAAAAAASTNEEADDADLLAPNSPPRAVGGRELRSPQVLPELLEAGGAASSARAVVAHAVDCEEEESDEEDDEDENQGADGLACSSSSSASTLPLLPATSSPLTANRPACYLVVHNVSKKHNVGSLARAATAFGVSEVREEGREEEALKIKPLAKRTRTTLSTSSTTSSLSFSHLSSTPHQLPSHFQVLLVGKNQYHAFGAHGSAAYVHFRHFPKLSHAKKWLREEKNAKLLGVEIDEGAVSVSTPGVFEGNTAFLMGNEVRGIGLERKESSEKEEARERREKEERERKKKLDAHLFSLFLQTKNSDSKQGTGLSPSQIAACDGLVYIPHHGQGTASLNVACAASIVLHRFSEFAAYSEAPRTAGKFDVAPRPSRNAPRGRANLDAAEIAALKEERAARKCAEVEVEGGVEALSLGA